MKHCYNYEASVVFEKISNVKGVITMDSKIEINKVKSMTAVIFAMTEGPILIS
ncbi:hypothetical protein [Clostridium beijerinckii]|uniref:Uncharacterized protein n=1 Tax=Clostridium beijerinckii TaxID=1520 RepID=A0A7X9XPD4_CLOBE|nr:hypothetical protein [Clostridium beijerinckii]NMF05254.1 hypothetical protein [Clostridium beijerinckii]